MAALSQNGWPAPPDDLVDFPWITGKVDADARVVLDYVAARFDSEVEKVIKGHSWGYAYRDIRGASRLSNHASGTAIDLNAPAHPLGRSGTFTPKQARRIRSIIGELDGAVRWGGDYSGRKDEMHFEINVAQAHLAKVARRIRNGQVAAVGKVPATYKVKPVPVDLDKVRHEFMKAAGVRKGKVRASNDVARVQQVLNRRLKAGLTVDGYVGKKTLNAWGRWERSRGVVGRPRIPDVRNFRPFAKGHFNWDAPPKKRPKTRGPNIDAAIEELNEAKPGPAVAKKVNRAKRALRSITPWRKRN